MAAETATRRRPHPGYGPVMAPLKRHAPQSQQTRLCYNPPPPLPYPLPRPAGGGGSALPAAARLPAADSFISAGQHKNAARRSRFLGRPQRAGRPLAPFRG